MDTIEITPAPGPVVGTAQVPGSKSITNRALALAALADGATTLHNALFADDTRRMMKCLDLLGFAVDADSLPANARVTHVSLFDGTLQVFELTDKPAFCFQGHPEASPGPHDIGYLFDRFIALMDAAKQRNA